MPELYYKEALKQAQREAKACAAQGVSPNPPSLDERIPPERRARGIALGIMQIPAEFIVGTAHAGRAAMLTRSFLPLAQEPSEFADKWKHLCQSHLDEGIRDPIKAYEYMNRYYVEEGNKRVSVLKFFGAPTVTADVTRVPPQRDGSPEVALYDELTAFYRYSRVNFIEFSRPGGCARLQQLLGKAPGEAWSDEERSAFAAAYHYFRQAYEACGGKKLSSTVGDAMLAFMNVYGYQALRTRDAGELRRQVGKLWEEIALQQEQEPIDVKLNPTDEKKAGLLTRILAPADAREARVAFVHDGEPGASGWTQGHELGRQHIQRVFDGRIRTRAYFDALDRDPLAIIERAIADGHGVVFTTSPRLLPASLRAAVEHPDVVILNCSLNASHRYIRTYYPRMYEAKFVSGAIAGALAEDGLVGYLCDYPIYGQIAGINAFALGAQMVNPRVRVRLEWSGVGGARAALERLTGGGVRLISARDLPREGEPSGGESGLFRYEGGEAIHLAMPEWRWGVYYESILRRIQDKSFQQEYEESIKALNYYWGMSAGVVALKCSDRLPIGVRKLADILQDGIRAGLYHPFRGPVADQAGRTMVDPGGVPTPEQIVRMDDLVQGVEGAIPAYEDLTDVGRATVDQVGVRRPAEAEG